MVPDPETAFGCVPAALHFEGDCGMESPVGKELAQPDSQEDS